MDTNKIFKEDINTLKRIYGVFNYKDLAKELDITESAIKGWVKRKIIPSKYVKIIEKNNKNIYNNGNNNINSNGKKNVNIHGDVHINNIEQQDIELCELIKQLEPKEKEYYYHLIKADLLKKNL
jgi:hypothetical protein